jgi:hypothetical protein
MGLLTFAGGVIFFLFVLPRILRVFVMPKTDLHYKNLYNESKDWMLSDQNTRR